MKVPTRPGGAVRLWSLPARGLHWSLAGSASAAWITHTLAVSWHEAAGWSVLGCGLARVLWGVMGPPHERVSTWWRHPRTVWAYVQSLRGQTGDVPLGPTQQGHTPLGACMVAALLACAALAGFSGALLSTDRYWGDPQWAWWHGVSAWGMLVLVVLHILGVLWTGRRHRVALVRSMVDGACLNGSGPQDKRSTPSSSQA